MTSERPYLRRVLIVSQFFWPEPGAPSVRYATIARVLVSQGTEVDVLTAVPNYPTGRIRAGYSPWRPVTEWHEGVRIQRLPLFAYGGRNKWLRLLTWASFSTAALVGIIATRRPDLVIVESPPLPLVVSAAAIARRHGARLLLFLADLWPDAAVSLGAVSRGWFYEALRALETLCYRLAWRITVPAEGFRDRLARRRDVGPERILFLPHGVDPEVFHPIPREECATQAEALGDLADRRVFLYPGTVGYAWELDAILDVADALRDDARIGFAILGDGPERERLMRRADAMRLSNLRFIPSVPPEEVARYLALSVATLLPLRDLAIHALIRPAKVLPSLACERPVILAGRGEMARLITDAGCGLVVPPGDRGALIEAVRSLGDRPEDAAALGRRGRAWALTEFDYRVLARRWIATVSDELARPDARLAAR